MIREASTQSEISSLIDSYGSSLAATLSRQDAISLFEKDGHSYNDMAFRLDPENIDTGMSGAILLLIAIYGQTKHEAYPAVIETALDNLFDHCKKTPTNDYSLYAGRAGVVYLFIHWYSITRNRGLLDKSCQLLAPANQEFLHSRYTSDYLFNGRAGTLLVIFQLYLLTGEKWLLNYIHQFVYKIVVNGNLSPNGVFWVAEDEVNNKPASGFAHGTAGIRYVFSRLNRYFKNATLSFLEEEIITYERSCWVAAFDNWGNYRKDIADAGALHYCRESYQKGNKDLFDPIQDYGWANGMAGMLFSYLPGQKEGTIPASLKMPEENALQPDGLYEGVAGLGMYLLGTGGIKNKPLLDSIVARLTRSLLLSADHISMDGGLLRGSPGQIYFLLQTMFGKHDENILAPFLHEPLPAEGIEMGIPFKTEDLKRGWLIKYFPRTINLLDKSAPDMLTELLQRPVIGFASEMMRVDSFIKNAYFFEEQFSAHTCLKDLYMLERRKLDFFLSDYRSSFRITMEEWVDHQKMLVNLNEPGEWLLSKKLLVSNKIKVLVSEWDWSFIDEHNGIGISQIDNINARPGRFEYILQVCGRREIVEFDLKQDTHILMHLFGKPRLVSQALQDIKQYIQSLPEKTLTDLLLKLSESSNTQDFLHQLDNTVLFKIRQWLYRGILSIQ